MPMDHIRIAPCKGIQDSSLGFWIPHKGFRIQGTGFRILCLWNVDSGSSLSCIPDSAAQDFRFHKQLNFLDFKIVIPLYGANVNPGGRG